MFSPPSPATTHQPEAPPYVQSLHYDPIDHPSPRLCFSATAGAATPASIHNTIVDARPSLPAAAWPSWTMIMKTIKGLGLRLLRA